MTPVETVARRGHEGSDHAADGAAFGSPTCNCLAVAGRIVPMLAWAWGEGLDAGQDRWMDSREFGDPPVNPYETKETDRG